MQIDLYFRLLNSLDIILRTDCCQEVNFFVIYTRKLPFIINSLIGLLLTRFIVYKACFFKQGYNLAAFKINLAEQTSSHSNLLLKTYRPRKISICGSAMSHQTLQGLTEHFPHNVRIEARQQREYEACCPHITRNFKIQSMERIDIRETWGSEPCLDSAVLRYTLFLVPTRNLGDNIFN